MAQILSIQVSLAQVLLTPANIILISLSMPLVPLLLAKHGHRQSQMHLKQNKYDNTQLSISRQKEIQRLLEKDGFKVVTSNKIVTSNKVITLKEVPTNTQGFNSRFFNVIKVPCITKAYEKSCLVMYTYNNEKKNIVLRHLPKIPGIS